LYLYVNAAEDCLNRRIRRVAALVLCSAAACTVSLRNQTFGGGDGGHLPAFASRLDLGRYLTHGAPVSGGAWNGQNCGTIAVSRSPLVAAANVNGRPAIIAGHVSEVDNNTPLIGGRVLVVGTQLGAGTTANGSFRFSVPHPIAGQAADTVRAIRIGYQEVRIPVSLAPGDSINIEIGLCQAIVHLGGDFLYLSGPTPAVTSGGSVGASTAAFVSPNGLRLEPLGELSSLESGHVDDDCRINCSLGDTNARPLSIGNRVFGLFGYELVEGRIRDGKIVEVRRLNLLQHR
jgi:hypothetical protein